MLLIHIVMMIIVSLVTELLLLAGFFCILWQLCQPQSYCFSRDPGNVQVSTCLVRSSPGKAALTSASVICSVQSSGSWQPRAF